MQKFNAPKAPTSPEEGGNIANDLKDYKEQQVEVEGQAAGGDEGASVNDGDWYEEEDDEEEHHAAH